jgi:hypothetical protein
MSDPAAVEPWDATTGRSSPFTHYFDARARPRVKRLFARWLAWTR